MAHGVDLRSTDFLGEARDLLRHVSAALANEADASSALVNRVRRRIERIGEVRLEELRDAQRALDSVGEDEDDWRERNRRDEAYEALQQFRRVAGELEEAGSSFAAKARILSGRGRQSALGGIASLEQRLDALGEYMAIRLPDAGSSDRVNGGKLSVSGTAPTQVSRATVDGTLPHGFAWLDISELDETSSFIDDPAEFKKGVTYGQMRRGLEILRDEIIPILEATGCYTRKDAERRDRELGTDYTPQGWVHPESRTTLWEAFLNPRREADVIAVERRSDGKLTVSSGRHRLGLARQVGLTRIPARFLGDNIGH